MSDAKLTQLISNLVNALENLINENNYGAHTFSNNYGAHTFSCSSDGDSPAGRHSQQIPPEGAAPHVHYVGTHRFAAMESRGKKLGHLSYCIEALVNYVIENKSDRK